MTTAWSAKGLTQNACPVEAADDNAKNYENVVLMRKKKKKIIILKQDPNT